jgi:DNA polymerase (family 10)
MNPAPTNKEIAKMLREVAAVYEVKEDSRFRVAAYNRAADEIEHSSVEAKDLWDERRLDDIPGVGKGIATYLDEYFQTGKVKHFESLKKGMPKGMFALLDIPGIGPKSAYKISKNLKVKSVADLQKAAEEGKIAELEGFGEQSQKEILKDIREYQRRSTRLLLPEAYQIAEKIIEVLETIPGVKRADTLGSLRRMVPTVGDVDIAVASTDPKAVVEAFVGMKDVQKVLAQGSAKASVVLKNDCQVDLRVQEPQSYGAQLQYFTGSKNHNIYLRKIANETGFSLSEYGIKERKMEGGRWKMEIKEFETEEDFYEFLGMQCPPPELREDTGEIEASLRSAQGKPNGLPDLVELKDIKGDLHLHCIPNFRPSHDPGISTMEEIVKKAAELGYEYVCMGNHNPSISQYKSQDIIKIIEDKSVRIEQLNSTIGKERGIKILNSFEVDILASKKLALENEALVMLDVVVAGIHSSMRALKEEMTKRLLVALENPYVHIISHPTGRLLLEREGYELDWDRVFAACKKYGKILEINAQPKRLDLPDTLVREAVRRGVKLAINTDAHHYEDMEMMRFGVSVARRGWAERGDIINTLSWPEFRKALKLKI